MSHQCIHDLLAAQAMQTPSATAIAAPGRTSLTYRHLLDHVEQIAQTLNRMGIGRSDRIAIILPNGPEMAVAFLAVTSCATSVLLNPAYRDIEFDFYIADLDIKALIVQSETNSPVRAIARARGIPVIELVPIWRAEAGSFVLGGDTCSGAVQSDFAHSRDIAVILHTPGTAARPKIVPLTQANICTSAYNIAGTLALTNRDRCLNIMPLSHSHGLVAAALSSLAAGANLICTPGFDATRFFAWMDECQPTWYTAVPTIHQAILAGAKANRQAIDQCQLCFIRSASAPLLPQTMSELERVFNAPVIQAYGMTEASHQITSNPLPPGQRKLDSVGIAAGPEVTIIDKKGNMVPSGETGEIAIRGDSITSGYEKNPTANTSAFTNGWFRTGDQGYLDDDNYLFITGRIQEIINRGNVTIAPREVDQVLLDHPAVAQATTFAVPHPTLGQDVVTAVVLRKDTLATGREIRDFGFSRLAKYKIPSQVVIVDDIPKGSAGKLQRIGLADKLASRLQAEFVAPRNTIENILGKIWSSILGIDQVSIYDNFFVLGGDWRLAAQLVSRVHLTFDIELPLPTIFREPTVADQAIVIEGMLLKQIKSLNKTNVLHLAEQPQALEAKKY